jgi:WD40 repeat protein
MVDFERGPAKEFVLDNEGNRKPQHTGTVRMVDTDTGEELHKLTMDEQIYHVGFFPDGGKVFISNENSTEIWDDSLEKQLEKLDGYGYKAGGIYAALSPDGKKFLAIEQDTQTNPANGRMTFGDGTVRIIDLERWVTRRPKIMDF